MPKLSLLSLVASLVLLPLASAHAEPFTGDVYEQKTNLEKQLFRVKREEKTEAGRVTIKATYLNLDGSEAVIEEAVVDESKGNKLLSYTLDQKQLGEKGKLELSKEGKLAFSYTKGGKTETRDEDYPSNLIVSLSLIGHLKVHWPEILGGKEVETRFGVLDRKETVGFKFFKIAERKMDGKDVVVVKMKPTSFVIAALVDPLILTFQKDNTRLLQLSGRTMAKKKVDSKWKDLDADIVYHYSDNPK